MSFSFLTRAAVRMLAGHVARTLDEAESAVQRRDPVAVQGQIRRLRELLSSLQTTLSGVLSGRVGGMVSVVHFGVDAMLEGVESRVGRGDFHGASQGLTRVRSSFDALVALLDD